jgi:hypothetical protein
VIVIQVYLVDRLIPAKKLKKITFIIFIRIIMNASKIKEFICITLITFWLMSSLGLPILVLRYIEFLGYYADLAVKRHNKKYKILPYLYKISTKKVVEPTTTFEYLLLDDNISITFMLGPLSIITSIYYFGFITVVFISHKYF